MRPLLKPALRRVWRDQHTLQIGLDPERAVVLGGITTEAARFIDSLDGTKKREQAIEAAPKIGVDEAVAARLLDLLAEGGVLEDASSDTRPLFELDAEERERIRPDLASISLVREAIDGGVGVLDRRRRTAIHLYGAGRIGAPLASLLATGGIGHILITDPDPARVVDTSPGGLTRDEVGATREEGARIAIRRVTGATRVTIRPEKAKIDFAIVTPVGPVDSRISDRLMQEGVPHIYLGIRETTGIIGPLVVPGMSSCLRCHNLYRSEKDPMWPRIAGQLAAGRRPWVTACDTGLAISTASLAALQILSFIDTGQSAAIDGTIDIRMPSGQVQRRSWTPHYMCGCSWGYDSYWDDED